MSDPRDPRDPRDSRPQARMGRESRAGREPRPGRESHIGRESRIGREARPRRPAPPPLEGDARVITLVLTGAWVAALVVVVLLRHHLPDPHRWIWTCVTGVGLGLFGLFYVPRLMRSRERAASRRAEDRQPR